MITAGIDLASQDAGTACCRIEWAAGRARLLSLELGTSDERIVEVLRSSDKVGIDVPLGWPVAFVEAIALHGRDGSWPTDYLHAENRELRFRRTDVVTHRQMGGSPPLSVSTDRIAIPAMRAAALLSRVEPRVPLDGSGVVVESYPAAALRRWGFVSRGYKRRENLAALDGLVDAFTSRTVSWLEIDEGWLQFCRSSDDAFDAVLCALVARAHALGRCEPIPEEDRDFASREGWIALPETGSLDGLAR